MSGSSLPPLHILGSGRAATSLARLLRHKAGFEIGAVVTAHTETAHEAARAIGAGRPSTEPADALQAGAITLLGLPEGELAPMAERHRVGAPLPGAVALHLSGALPGAVLAPLTDRGMSVGSIHPMFSFAEPADSLENVGFVIEGQESAVAAAREWVNALGGIVLELGEAQKPLHHAAAAVTSNALVALFDLALRLEEAAGVARADAARALLPLLRGTVDNLARIGSPKALTGPIERGEIDVLRRHLSAIDSGAPEEAALYRSLARATVKVAAAKGSLSPQQVTDFSNLLGTEASE